MVTNLLAAVKLQEPATTIEPLTYAEIPGFLLEVL